MWWGNWVKRWDILYLRSNLRLEWECDVDVGDSVSVGGDSVSVGVCDSVGDSVDVEDKIEDFEIGVVFVLVLVLMRLWELALVLEFVFVFVLELELVMSKSWFWMNYLIGLKEWQKEKMKIKLEKRVRRMK